MNFESTPHDNHEVDNMDSDKPITIGDLRLTFLLGIGRVIETPEGLVCKFLVQGELDEKSGETLEEERYIPLDRAELARRGIWIIMDPRLSNGRAELRGDVWPIGEDGAIQIEQVCIPPDTFEAQ